MYDLYNDVFLVDYFFLEGENLWKKFQEYSFSFQDDEGGALGETRQVLYEWGENTSPQVHIRPQVEHYRE
jgi:hypothetical protein